MKFLFVHFPPKTYFSFSFLLTEIVFQRQFAILRDWALQALIYGKSFILNIHLKFAFSFLKEPGSFSYKNVFKTIYCLVKSKPCNSVPLYILGSSYTGSVGGGATHFSVRKA